MNQNTKFGLARAIHDCSIPTVKHQFNAATGEMVKQNISEPFLRGPIPISWLNRAAQLGGKTLNVAIAIRWIHGMSGNQPIKLSKKALQSFHVSSDAASDALNRMEANGLIRLSKKPGQRPAIDVLAIDSKSSGE